VIADHRAEHVGERWDEITVELVDELPE
jgi:hypothetical protein